MLKSLASTFTLSAAFLGVALTNSTYAMDHHHNRYTIPLSASQSQMLRNARSQDWPLNHANNPPSEEEWEWRELPTPPQNSSMFSDLPLKFRDQHVTKKSQEREREEKSAQTFPMSSNPFSTPYDQTLHVQQSSIVSDLLKTIRVFHVDEPSLEEEW